MPAGLKFDKKLDTSKDLQAVVGGKENQDETQTPGPSTSITLGTHPVEPTIPEGHLVGTLEGLKSSKDNHLEQPQQAEESVHLEESTQEQQTNQHQIACSSNTQSNPDQC